MRVGFGALTMSAKEGVRQSGIHHYSAHLIAHLPAALEPDELVVYSALPGSGAGHRSVAHYKPFIPLENPAVRTAWEQTRLPVRLRKDRIDLYHGPAFVVPKLARVPSVATIHDLAFLRWPDQTTRRRSRYLSKQVRQAVGQATRIIAVSEHTRREIAELLDVDPDRVDVTPLGVDPAFRPSTDDEIEHFRTEKGLMPPFILAVGNLEPRKNLDALVKAFDAIATEIPHDLVLAGAEGWKSGRLMEAIAASPYRDRIRTPGFVPRQDLPLWYSSCDAFVIPSLDEGFGLTLLEALSCGAPAVVANRGALPEVAGHAALLTEPNDCALAAALTQILESRELQSSLRAQGPVRAARFTWQRTAELTVRSYRKAMA
ncbi:MAG: glycosyltransferase family 1 protein [Thermomicrobiales bacterium]